MKPAFDRITCLLGDITTQDVDALVNAANTALRGGGGVDGAIHAAAGPGLLAELVERYPSGCATGEVRITGGHELRARHVLHAAGPVWRGGHHGEAAALASCYSGALALAVEHDLRTLAFPAISAGIYGYPWGECARVSLTALAGGLADHESVREARMVLFSEPLFEVFEATAKTLRA